MRTVVTALLTSLLLASPLAAQRIKLPVKLDELERRAVADSNDAAAHYNVALGYWNEKRYDDAKARFEEALALDPQFAAAYLALAYLPFARRPALWGEASLNKVPDEWKDALTESDRMYRRAFLIDPLVDLRIVGATLPRKNLYWVQSAYGSRVYQILYQGFDDFLQGDYDNAYKSLNRLVVQLDIADPEDVPTNILWYRGLAAGHTERFDKAQVDLEELYERSLEWEESQDELIHIPLRTNDYRYMLAAIQERSGHADEAIRMYQEVLENDIGNYMAHVRMAEMYEASGMLAEALVERERAVAANPDDSSLLIDMGITLGKMQKWSECERALRDAARGNPRDSRALYYLGIVQMQTGELAAARESFDTFLSLAPSRYEPQIQDAERRLDALR